MENWFGRWEKTAIDSFLIGPSYSTALGSEWIAILVFTGWLTHGNLVQRSTGKHSLLAVTLADRKRTHDYSDFPYRLLVVDYH